MRHCGYRRNPLRRERPLFSSHFAALNASPKPLESVSLAPFDPPIFDQGVTGSCVGHARARGIYISRAASGKPLPFIPSPSEIYKLALCYERIDWHTPLVDSGCDPVDSIEAVSLLGVKGMTPLPGRFSDADPDTITIAPTLESIEEDHKFPLLNDHLITEKGKERARLFCAAITAGYPVCFDVPGGSDEWQSYTGGILVANRQQLDHYVCAIGYGIDSQGALTVIGDNSWGDEWGFSGRFFADESVLQAATDVIVCVEDESNVEF